MSLMTERIDAGNVPDHTRVVIGLEVAPLADGSMLRVPVHVLAGRGRKPCLLAAAGIHGDEAEGISALLELSNELALSDLRGRLILVPIANPPAFGANQRRSPLDGLDLNRIFPGRVDGTPSERLAYSLFELARDNADFLFTLHGWYATGDTLPFVEVAAGPSPVRARSYEAAAASGFSHVRAADWHSGLFPAAVTNAGIPAMEGEIGGRGYTRPPLRSAYRSHVLALMKHLGMLDGDPPPPGHHVYVSEHVRPRSGGVLFSGLELGARVAEGQPLGSVHDLEGVIRETLIAPFDGVLMARRNYLSVSPGDLAFTLFRRVMNPQTS